MDFESRRRNHVRNSVTMLCAAIVFVTFSTPTSVQATTIAIDLGTSPNITSHVGDTFTDLNGTPILGQTMSLDFMFTNGNFVRLFTVTQPLFDVSLQLRTSGVGSVGLLTGTGYLLDKFNFGFLTPQELGSASSDDASMFVGLFPLLSGQLESPSDFYGIHLDLIFPINPSVSITEGQFDLIASGLNNDDRFGIGPGVPSDIVPDSGGTILLLGASMAALVWLRSRTAAA